MSRYLILACFSFHVASIPSGSDCIYDSFSGGVAALNRRLMAGIPSGCEGSADGCLSGCLFDALRMEKVWSHVDESKRRRPCEIAASADGSVVAYAMDGHVDEIHLLDGKNGTPKKRLAGFRDLVRSLQIDPEGKWLGAIVGLHLAIWQLNN